ncbi:MAG: aldose 1-epimerase [Spirochaetia bacterium]
MYVKSEYKAGSYNVIRIEREDGVFFDIIPDLGAMVYRISLKDRKGIPVDILRFDKAEELSDNPLFRGRLLFPFNDRIPEGRFHYKGCDYQLPINEKSDGSAIHGLLYNREFEVRDLNLSENEASITLGYTIKKGDWYFYPFSLDFSVTYRLSEKGFSVDFTFVNQGEIAMLPSMRI